MKTSYPFTKCLHPKQIVNPYTREVLMVPCGSCEVCALQKSAMNTLKCKLECRSHKYNEFVTLTYSDTYVPKAQVIPLRKSVVKEYFPMFLDYDEQFKLSSSLQSIGDMYNYVLVDVSGRFDTDGMVLGAAWMRDIDWFSLRNKVGYGDTINVLRYEDVQLFLKRIREKIFRLYGQKIRYYCVGEYGPEHYRPHWHLILSYDCSFLAQGIREIIRSCWKFGRIDTGKSRGKCASYCAGYVNSSFSLPAIYRGAQTKPKSYHSIRLGEEFCKVSKEEVYQSKDFGFVKQCINLDDVPTEFNMWRSFTARLFPKCKAYSVKSIEERVASYRLETLVTKVYGSEVKLTSVARKILGYILRFRRGYPLTLSLENDKDLFSLVDYFVSSNEMSVWITPKYTTLFTKFFPSKERLFRSIYMELLCSRYFIRYIAKSHDYSICKEKVLVIDEFYKEQDYNCLKRQLQWQQDNLTEKSSFQDYKYLYNDIYYEDGEMDDNFYYCRFREAQLKNFKNSIKHKKLNDKMNVRTDNY